MISAKEKAEADRIGQLNFAWDKGVAEGRAKGRSDAQAVIARNLRAAGVSPDVIAQSTGLLPEAIEGL